MAAEANERPFIFKWRSAIWNSTLSSSAKLACICLSEFANSDGSKCFPSLPTIARVTGLNEKTVRRNLTLAVDAGFIKRTAIGGGQEWRNYLYTPQLPEGADITPTRSVKGAGITPARSEKRRGHFVPKVRTLCPEGAGVMPTDLSITYPVPIKEQERHHEANSPSEEELPPLPDWLDLASWVYFFKAHSQWPPTALQEKHHLEMLEDLRNAGHDPNDCLDQARISGSWDVLPVLSDDQR